MGTTVLNGQIDILLSGSLDDYEAAGGYGDRGYVDRYNNPQTHHTPLLQAQYQLKHISK
jgi:hypothetical protein